MYGPAPSDRPSSSVANYVDLVANEVPSGDLFPKKWVEIVKPLKLSVTIAGCLPPTNTAFAVISEKIIRKRANKCIYVTTS